MAKVACHVGGLGMVDGGLVIFLDLSRLLFPSCFVEDASVCADCVNNFEKFITKNNMGL